MLPSEGEGMSTADQSDEIVRLATARNPFEAHVWEQALKEKGISAKVTGDFLDAGLGDIPGLRAEVWVHRDDLARAQEVLRERQIVAEQEPEEES
jgi:Putative prokaryotic signal transducing protein